MPNLLAATRNQLLFLALLGLAKSGPSETDVQPHSAPTGYDRAIAQGVAAVRAGQLRQALTLFRMGISLAEKDHDQNLESRALLKAMGVQIRLFAYRDALATAEQLRKIANEIRDEGLKGSVENNVATVYTQLGSHRQALYSAQAAIYHLRLSGQQSRIEKALVNLGDIYGELSDFISATACYREALTVAKQAGSLEDEAEAQTHLGEMLTDARDFTGARTALGDAVRIYNGTHDLDHLASVNGSLADLFYRQGEYQTALRYVDIAGTSGSVTLRELPPFEQVHLRGQILRELGRDREALIWFRRAVRLADNWAYNVPASDVANVRSAVKLNSIFQDYVDECCHLSLRWGSAALSQEAFKNLIAHRARALRVQALANLQRQARLPPRYFEILSKLQLLQSRAVLDPPGPSRLKSQAELTSLRAELTDLEFRQGIAAGQFGDSEPTSAQAVQSRLAVGECLFTYALGSRSYVWAMTQSTSELIQLPSDTEIARLANHYTTLVQSSGNYQPAALELAKSIFPSFRDSTPYLASHWIIAADGALLAGVPFSALPNPVAGPDGKYHLAEAHDLRFVPTPAMIARAPVEQKKSFFLGVGDPVYNLADPRWHRAVDRVEPANMQRGTARQALLSRLVGTAVELNQSVKALQAPFQLLIGPEATVENIRHSLVSQPSIVHFAVHVIRPDFVESGMDDEAALALSLTKDRYPEALTREAISTFSRLPGGLVVLSGCSSQKGDNLPSAGMIGLSRAWLVSGASAVLVSAWPTTDDTGAFFANFYDHYRRLAQLPVAKRAARALAMTQADFSNNKEYASDSTYWAAYSVITRY